MAMAIKPAERLGFPARPALFAKFGGMFVVGSLHFIKRK